VTSDSHGDFRGEGGGRTSLLLPPGAENPSYATALWLCQADSYPAIMCY